MAANSIWEHHGKYPTDVEFIQITQAAAGTSVVHASKVGHRFYLMGVFGTLLQDDSTLQFQQIDATALTGPMSFANNGGLVALNGGAWSILHTADGQGLQLVTTTDGFNGLVRFLEVPDWE